MLITRKETIIGIHEINAPKKQDVIKLPVNLMQ